MPGQPIECGDLKWNQEARTPLKPCPAPIIRKKYCHRCSQAPRWFHRRHCISWETSGLLDSKLDYLFWDPISQRFVPRRIWRPFQRSVLSNNLDDLRGNGARTDGPATLDHSHAFVLRSRTPNGPCHRYKHYVFHRDGLNWCCIFLTTETWQRSTDISFQTISPLPASRGDSRDQLKARPHHRCGAMDVVKCHLLHGK